MHHVPAQIAHGARDQDGAGGADGTSLGRRCDPPVDRSDHQHGQHQHRHDAAQSAEFDRPRRALLQRRRKLRAQYHFQDHGGGEQDRHHDARQDAGDEQVADRCLGEDAIDDHRHARRDEDAERAARGGRPERERLVVAALDHFRHRHRTDGRGGHRAGAADRGKNRASEYGRDGQRTGKPAQPHMRGAKEIVPDPGRRQCLAHQHEQRNDHEHEVARLGEGDVAELAQRVRRNENRRTQNADGAERDRHRRPRHHQGHEDNDEREESEKRFHRRRPCP